MWSKHAEWGKYYKTGAYGIKLVLAGKVKVHLSLQVSANLDRDWLQYFTWIYFDSIGLCVI